MDGTITLTPSGPLMIHSWTAPERGWRTSCHLIELPDRLVLVDVPLVADLLGELLGVARDLGKPLDRVLITHAHPDHFATAGLARVPVYALAATAARISAAGPGVVGATYLLTGVRDDLPPAIGDLRTLAPSSEVIGGVRFEYGAVADAETAAQLTVTLPDHDVLLTGDLVYDDVHLFVAEHGFDGWLAALDALEALPFTQLLPGHGLPGGRELIGSTRDYLVAAREAYRASSTAEEFAARIDEVFPDRGGLGMRPVQARFLYPPVSA